MSPASGVATVRRPVSAAGEWWERAACLGLDTSLFFPGRGESTAEAEAVCASCEVRGDCLWFALGDNSSRRSEKFGIWGGSSERQRRRLRRETRAAAEEVAPW